MLGLTCGEISFPSPFLAPQQLGGCRGASITTDFEGAVISPDRQAPEPSGARSTISSTSPRTFLGNSPKRDTGEAPAYRELARIAAEAGYPEVTPSRVHTWVTARLLPPTAERVSRGSRGFSSELRDGAVAQLIALAKHRRITANRHTLAVLLWLDGWDVPRDLVRSALLSVIPRRTLSDASDEVLDRLDRLAAPIASLLVRRFRPGTRGARVAVDAAAALIPAVHGAYEADEYAARNLELIAQLDRGRTDRLEGTPAWLTGTARAPWRFMSRHAHPSRVRHYIRCLPAEELDRTRRHAGYLAYELPAFARAFEVRFGAGFAGLRALAMLTTRHAEIPAAVAVVVDRFPSLSRRLDLLIDGLAPQRQRRDALLAIAQAYASEHPDQRAALRRYGLDGLLERGQLRRLSGHDELLRRAERLA